MPDADMYPAVADSVTAARIARRGAIANTVATKISEIVLWMTSGSMTSSPVSGTGQVREPWTAHASHPAGIAGTLRPNPISGSDPAWTMARHP